MIDGDSRIIYVPVETRAREWDAKLLFSLVAASANFQVALGPKWLFNANTDRLPKGLYGCKTLNQMDAVAMEAAAANGHTAYAWDEEGPGQILAEVYLKSICPDAVTRAEQIFAWGDHQAAMMAQRFPEAAHKIMPAGNPRWDLLRPEFRAFFKAEAKALRAAHGPFILINTNFATYNSWFGDGLKSIGALAEKTGAFDSANQADQRMLADIRDFEEGVFRSYAEALPALSAAFPAHTIIVRPHPVENHQPWRDLAAPLPNVKALHEGVVIPWIIAADAVVQNSCTTGVEALALGRPVVSYCKFESAVTPWHLASHVTPRVRDIPELIGCLRGYVSAPDGFAAQGAAGLALLKRHISHLSGATSTQAIVAALRTLALRREQGEARFDRVFAVPEGLRPYPKTKYLAMKFPPVAPEELVDAVQRLTARHPALGDVTISHLAESLFLFRRKT